MQVAALSLVGERRIQDRRRRALAARHPRVLVEAMEVLDHAGVDRLAGKYAGQPIDVLLNNAGIGGGGENQIFGKLRYDVFPADRRI